MPIPATKWVIVGRSARISSAVPSSCASGFAALPYWNGMKYLGSWASRRATSMDPFVPLSPSLNTISAPNSRSRPIRSWLALSGITTVSLYPLRAATIASAIPVLPDVGSRIVLSGVRSPDASATSIIFLAIRSLVEPVGLLPSSLAHRRTPGLGDMCGMPTSGVFPMASRMLSYRTRPIIPAPTA